MNYNTSILTPKAFDFLIKKFIRKLDDKDWESIHKYRELEFEREYIVDGIIEEVEQKISETLKTKS